MFVERPVFLSAYGPAVGFMAVHLALDAGGGGGGGAREAGEGGRRPRWGMLTRLRPKKLEVFGAATFQGRLHGHLRPRSK